MLNCYIIDDTPSVIRQLKKFIDQTSMLHFTGATETGEEALHMMQKLKSKVDLIFLDIELPDISGLTLLDSLSKDYIIILVSGHRHFAEEAFIKGAAGYLFKPLSYDRFLAAVNKAKEMAGTKKRTVLRPPKYIYLPGGGREVRTTILTASITFVQASGSFCSIFFDNAPPFHCSLSLKQLGEVLSPPAFIQVNRSVIVNKSKIIRYDANDVFLDENKQIFAITDKFKESFIASLTSDGHTF